MAGGSMRKAPRTLKAGDHVRARIGRREVDGTVTSASGGLVRVTFEVEDADEPISRLYRENQLRSA